MIWWYGDNLPKEGLDKLKVLINFISPAIFEYISDWDSYNSAIEIIKNIYIYIRPPNTIFAHHLLATCLEHHGETFGEYIQALKILAISAIQHQDEAIRDAFFNGINSNNI